jgi:hypothetical protein
VGGGKGEAGDGFEGKGERGVVKWKGRGINEREQKKENGRGIKDEERGVEATEERGSWEEEGTGHVTQAIFLDSFLLVAGKQKFFLSTCQLKRRNRRDPFVNRLNGLNSLH